MSKIKYAEIDEQLSLIIPAYFNPPKVLFKAKMNFFSDFVKIAILVRTETKEFKISMNCTH